MREDIKMKKEEELKMVKKVKKRPKDGRDPSKLVKKLKSQRSMAGGDKQRRKSLTIHHHSDDRFNSMINDISADEMI